MILIVTNRQDYTADFLIQELQGRKADYIRFNTEDYPQKVSINWRIDDNGIEGYFLFPKCKISFNDILSVWYRRPVTPVPSSEIQNPVDYEFVVVESDALLRGIWNSLDCFWISHPENLRLAENKLLQLKVATNIGFNIPPTLVTTDPKASEKFYNNFNGEIIYKPLYRGRLVRESGTGLIFTNPVTHEDTKNFNNVSFAPTLLQKEISKGYDIRVTVIGKHVYAVKLHSQEIAEARSDWRRVEATRIRHQPFILPDEIQELCTTLLDKFGLAFGAIDLVLTPDDNYFFLEINPNGQWAWLQQICPELPLRETLAKLLCKRVKTS